LDGLTEDSGFLTLPITCFYSFCVFIVTPSHWVKGTINHYTIAFKGFGVLMCFEIMVGWFCILNVKWLVDGGLKAMV
jgi:hypothetical protein